MKKQSGFINITAMDFFVFVVILMVIGWAIIEGIVWIASHISIEWIA